MRIHRRYLALTLTVLALLISSCGNSSKSANVDLDSTYSPRKSLSDAVTAVLQAEQKNDHAASFALLSPNARSQYKDVADWTRRRNELPAVTEFNLESAKDATQTVIVEHKAALDPFKGLSPAKERQIWSGRRYSAGWLVDPDPQTDPILPNDAKASTAVKAWAEAVQACDRDRAQSLQAIPELLASTAPALCRVPGPVTVSAPDRLPEGPESANIIAQYSTDAFGWAKSVAVTSPSAFHVVIAPIGEEWKVLALY